MKDTSMYLPRSFTLLYIQMIQKKLDKIYLIYIIYRKYKLCYTSSL